MLRIALIVLTLSVFQSDPVKQTKWKSRYVVLKVTAYCPCKICCRNYANGKTSIGRNAYLPGLAINTDAFSYGMYFDVPGYKRGPNKNGSWIMADDTGGGIAMNQIDIRFKTHQEAVNWGVKTLRVRVWEKQ